MNEINNINLLLWKMRQNVCTLNEYKTLQNELIKYSNLFENNYPICMTSTNAKQIIILSDTHKGSIYESKVFMDYVYNYAINNRVDFVIHTGDLIEGTTRKHDRSFDELKEEIINAVNYIGNFGLKSKLLLGNHDFSVINKYSYPTLTDEFFKSSNVDVLGLGKVILNINNIPIKLNHKISEKLIRFETDTYDTLTLEGHSHMYYLDEYNKTIKVPSLSYELKDGMFYSAKALLERGITLSGENPYLDFLKASFIDNDVILFEEYREKGGYLVTPESAIYDVKTKTLKRR